MQSSVDTCLRTCGGSVCTLHAKMIRSAKRNAGTTALRAVPKFGVMTVDHRDVCRRIVETRTSVKLGRQGRTQGDRRFQLNGFLRLNCRGMRKERSRGSDESSRGGTLSVRTD